MTPPIPEDQELNWPERQIHTLDMHKDCRERIAKLTAEVERLKAEHAYYVSIQEPQHRQALEERDEARAENTRLKAPVSDEEWERFKRPWGQLRTLLNDLIRSRAAIKEGQ